jgi:hypothetical protein
MTTLANMMREKETLFKNELSSARNASRVAIDEKEKIITQLKKELALS